MKKLLLALTIVALGCAGVQAQGTVDFRNRATGVIDAPVFFSDGTTLVAGADYAAQLFYSLDGTFVSVAADPAPFRTGAGAGYWNAGTDSTRILEGIAGGSAATLQVRVWNAAQYADYDAAVAAGGVDSYGFSAEFDIVTGGGNPPLPSAAMVNMESFALVPEPSMFVLAALGAVGLLLFRRRK